MALLDDYLNYLHESELHETVGGFVSKAVVSGAESGLMWGLFYIPATILAWKTANALFSKAVRKCGGIRKSTPGFKVCVARERIKALEQKVKVADKILSGCHGAKNPELCKQKFTLEKEKAQNKIELHQNKIRQILGEQQFLTEVDVSPGGVAKGVTGFGIPLVVQSVVDKGIFLVTRTVQGAFKKDVRKCGVYKDSAERNICISKLRLAALNQKLGKLMPLAVNCSKDSNPAKCQEKIQKHIDKTNREIQIAKDNIVAYNNEMETQKREEEFKKQMKMQKKLKKKTAKETGVTPGEF